MRGNLLRRFPLIGYRLARMIRFRDQQRVVKGILSLTCQAGMFLMLYFHNKIGSSYKAAPYFIMKVMKLFITVQNGLIQLLA